MVRSAEDQPPGANAEKSERKAREELNKGEKNTRWETWEQQLQSREKRCFHTEPGEEDASVLKTQEWKQPRIQDRHFCLGWTNRDQNHPPALNNNSNNEENMLFRHWPQVAQESDSWEKRNKRSEPWGGPSVLQRSNSAGRKHLNKAWQSPQVELPWLKTQGCRGGQVCQGE